MTGGVRFVEEIPKSASGKILKRVLREEAEEEARRKLVDASSVVASKL